MIDASELSLNKQSLMSRVELERYPVIRALLLSWKEQLMRTTSKLFPLKVNKGAKLDSNWLERKVI